MLHHFRRFLSIVFIQVLKLYWGLFSLKDEPAYSHPALTYANASFHLETRTDGQEELDSSKHCSKSSVLLQKHQCKKVRQNVIRTIANWILSINYNTTTILESVY